jgi:hypothetical protein
MIPHSARHAAHISAATLPFITACLLTSPGAVGAAEVGALVSATAIDAPGQFGFVQDSDSRIAGPVQGTPPVLSLGAIATSGSVLSNAGVQTNAYTGQIRGSAVSMVGADVPAAGRGGSARFSGSMTGSITLGSAGLPGMATFLAVVEGAYNFGTLPSRFKAYIEANGVVGDLYRGVNRVDFDPFAGAGLFSFPGNQSSSLYSRNGSK